MIRKRRLFIWAVLACTLFASDVFAALGIDADFYSGSIGAYTIDDASSTIKLVARTETLENTSDRYTYWMNFKVLDAIDRTVTFHITNARTQTTASGRL